MKKRQRRKHEKDLRHDQFAPNVAAGLTFGTLDGISKREALEAHPVKRVDASQAVAHMTDADQRMFRRDGRAMFAPFVARNSTDAVWTDGVTGRPQMDYSATFTKEGLDLLKEGRQCLRCGEPHPEKPFPVSCDFCGYAMKDRQVMDIAMEFEGERHLGPSRPIAEYLEEIELRKEKRRFIKRVREGGMGRIPKSWLRDATLGEGTDGS